MKTPEENWTEFRDFVYKDLEEEEEIERQRAFHAGSEAVFQLMKSCNGMPLVQVYAALSEYREANRAAALETIPPEERE